MKRATIKSRKFITSLPAVTNIPDILLNIYSSRGITDLQDLDYGLHNLPSPTLMKSNMAAAKLLAEAISCEHRLLIIADFDVDGATSCALMVLALQIMGAKNVHYLVPDRFKFGYGLTPEIVDVAAQLSPDLLITVDNGISSISGVERANELGIDVLITDHHLPGIELPKAKAIVNPNQSGCEFPTKALAGVGVAFYLMLALRMQLREQSWFEQQGIEEPNLSQFLDLVALGTIADIVPLDYCNRILVTQGMKRIRAGRCREGIAALLTIGNKELSRLQTNDLGFAVGPRLNAAGRLDDMSLGIECLLTENKSKAFELAGQLESLNNERRDIEAKMQKEAMESLQQLSLKETLNADKTNYGLCLYQPRWHQGIIGLLASRIKDKVHRPVIVFANADSTDAELKGSARSITGIHIRDILALIATEHPHLLSKFGGHAMAAGMTIVKSNLKEFSSVFSKTIAASLKGQFPEHIIWTDGELSCKDITLNLAREISQAGPWGQAFEEPLFHGDFKVISKRVLSGKHLKLQLENLVGKAFDGIAFFQEDEILNSRLDNVRLVYKMDVNYFRDQENLQLMIEQLVPL